MGSRCDTLMRGRGAEQQRRDPALQGLSSQGLDCNLSGNPDQETGCSLEPCRPHKHVYCNPGSSTWPIL